MVEGCRGLLQRGTPGTIVKSGDNSTEKKKSYVNEREVEKGEVL